MKISIFKSIFVFIALFIFNNNNKVISQEVIFNQISNDSQFNTQAILTIAQDKSGRLWFGGQAELYIYNSISIQQLSDVDSSTRQVYYINKIFIDDHNNLLISAANGFFVYSIDKNKFINNNSFLTRHQVNDIICFNNKIYVASYEGLYEIQYNVEKNLYEKKKHLFKTRCQSLEVSNNSLFFSSENKIFTFLTNQSSSKIKLTAKLPIVNDYITDLHLNNKNLWVGTHNNGVFKFENNRLQKTINTQTSDILSDNIRKITTIHEKLYVGTLKGLSIISPDQTIKNYINKNDDANSISQNSIYDIFQDNQQIIWIATYFGGINSIYPREKQINNYVNSNISKYKLASNIISSVVDYHNNLFIGTEENGLQVIDKKTGKSTIIPTPSNLIKALAIQDNKLIIGQHIGGITILNLDNYTTENIKLKHIEKNRANNIITILPTVDGTYYTTDVGVYFITKDDKVIHYKSLSNIYI